MQDKIVLTILIIFFTSCNEIYSSENDSHNKCIDNSTFYLEKGKLIFIKQKHVNIDSFWVINGKTIKKELYTNLDSVILLSCYDQNVRSYRLYRYDINKSIFLQPYIVSKTFYIDLNAKIIFSIVNQTFQDDSILINFAVFNSYISLVDSYGFSSIAIRPHSFPITESGLYEFESNNSQHNDSAYRRMSNLYTR